MLDDLPFTRLRALFLLWLLSEPVWAWGESLQPLQGPQGDQDVLDVYSEARMRDPPPPVTAPFIMHDPPHTCGSDAPC